MWTIPIRKILKRLRKRGRCSRICLPLPGCGRRGSRRRRRRTGRVCLGVKCPRKPTQRPTQGPTPAPSQGPTQGPSAGPFAGPSAGPNPGGTNPTPVGTGPLQQDVS